MDTLTQVLVVAGIFALVAIAFFAVFRGKGTIKLQGPGGVSLQAEGENPPPPGIVAPGVKIHDADAGRDLRAKATGAGGVDLDKVKAKGSIDATHEPGSAPPKT